MLFALKVIGLACFVLGLCTVGVGVWFDATGRRNPAQSVLINKVGFAIILAGVAAVIGYGVISGGI